MLRPGRIDAPAKINLTLEVLARRSDGYHGVRSVMLPIELEDTIQWEPAPTFSFTSSDGAPSDESNLIVRAFRALEIEPPLHISLEKNIPASAGLGGGSSDAAAILDLAARGAFGDLGPKDYLTLARGLGSDVPFFLAMTGALVEGTGERVTALGALPLWWVVLVVPPVAIATPGAYAALDAARGDAYESRPRNASPSLAAVEAVQRGDFAAAIAASVNDFEPVIAAREPLVAEALDALRAAGARVARLCGSGSACFALVESLAEGAAISERLHAPAGARVEVVAIKHAANWRGEERPS
jgi:4-diphosphocytidyl-2-C-methyl-D-erythritol kinase